MVSTNFYRYNNLRNAILLVTASLSVITPAIAQQPLDHPACVVASDQPSVTLTGTISDPSGARVAAGRIEARCGDFHRDTQSLSDGTYSLSLPPGTYIVKVDASRFASLSRGIAIAAGQPNEANFSLSVQQAQTTVDVLESPGYVAIDSGNATKADIPLMEMPQSIAIVERKLMNDQGVIILDEALKNVAGVVPGGYYAGWDYYRIRGFDASFNTYIDGLRGGNGVAEETYGLQSVQVLKGPSSSLYGQSVLGGIVDLRSKLPEPTRFADIQFTGGNFGLYEGAIDAGTPFNSSQTLYGRLVALYRSTDSFVNYAYDNRMYLAPSFTWRITPAATLTVLSRFQKDTGRAAFPLPADGTVLPNPNGEIPIDTYIGELNGANQLEENNQGFGYRFTYKFNDNYVFQSNARFSWYGEHWNDVMYPAYLGEDQRTLYRYPLDWDGTWQNYVIDNNFTANFTSGRLRHSVLVGVDFLRNPQQYLGKSIDFADSSQYIPIDVYNPVYGASLPGLNPYTSGTTITQDTGVYIQDQIQLPASLFLTIGGRYDFAINQTNSDPSAHENAFTPRVGLTYRFKPDVSIYASFSKSFLPQSGMIYDGSANGRFAPPETGQQWEAGIKTAFLNGKLDSTFAIFQLNRNNVITTDPYHPNFYILTGAQRSRGIELENTMHLGHGFNFTAAYAYIDAKVTEDTAIPPGTPLLNVPQNAFSAWGTYEFFKGWARGLGFGFGGRYYTDQSGDLMDTFKLPAYGIMDASAFYNRGRFRVQVNCYNITDTHWYSGSYNDLYVNPGSPFSVRTTVGWRF